MEAKLLLAVLIVVLILWAAFSVRRWILAQWLIVHLWRWFSGMPLHGKHITNAGWKRKGYGDAMTQTGHALWWWYLPRWKRASHRTGGTLAVMVLVWGALVNPRATVALLLALVVAGLGLAGVRAWRAWQDRKHHHTWLEPLHLAAHELAGHPRALPAKSWITAELDDGGAVKRAQLALPAGWSAEDRDKERLVTVARRRLGMEGAKVTWRSAGPKPLMTLEPVSLAPEWVRYDQVMEAVEDAEPDEFVFGIGQEGKIVKASLVGDSPHMAINMGSGAGKSSLASFLLVQWLRRGAFAMVLDAKWASLAWCFKDAYGEYDYLPNVAYLSSVEGIHDGLCWLGEQLRWRNQAIAQAKMAGGGMRASVGRPIVVVAEEMNYVTPDLKDYWTEIRKDIPGAPKKSPALKALGALAFAGREADMYGLLIGQMLTADATGSRDNSIKTNIGIWAMARYGPSSWNTAVGRDVAMPPSPSHVGRIQLVTADGVRETQTPKPDGVLYRHLVMSGDVTPCPVGMPGARHVRTVLGAKELPEGGSEQAVVLGNGHSAGGPGDLVTLDEAVRRGISKRTKEALQRASTREPEFPAAAFPKRQGVAAKYDAVKLAEYEAAR